MASEVGQGYVSIIPSARGFASRLQREIGSDLQRAGRKGGEEYGKGFEKTAVDEAGSSKVSGGITDKLKVGLAAGGVAAGALLVAGIGEALERGKLESRLAAQLGGGRTTQRATKAAADLFAGAWGESVGEVNDAVASVVTNIGGMRKASERELEGVTAAVLDIATAFDQDASAITRTIDQLVRTDMAKGPKEALDIITRGFQTGANEADDLLDTFNEYSTQFRKLGIDGDQAMGLLTQGLRAGARDADVVADAFKEFSIRAVDDSKLTKQSFDALGLSADDMEDKIARGGESAADATAKVLDKLRRVEDPAKRAQIAVGLFGTQSEDLGDALFALDPRNAVDTLGKVGGAAKRMGDTLNDNAATRLESFKRQMQGRFVNFLGNEVIPAAEDLWRKTGPDVRRFGRALANMGEDIGPVVKDTLPIFANVLGDVAGAVGKFATAFNKLPAPVQAALISGGLFALLRGRGGGLGAAAVGAGTGAVAGGIGAGTAAAGGATAGAALKGAARRVVLPAVGVGLGMNWIDKWVDENLDPAPVKEFSKNLDLLGSDFSRIMGRITGFGPVTSGVEEAEQEIAQVDAQLAKLARRNPGRAFAIVRRFADEAGMSAGDLARKHLPRLSDQLDNTHEDANASARGARRLADQWGRDLPKGAGKGGDAARGLGKDIKDVPDRHNTEFDVDTRQARADTSNFVRDLASKLRGIKDEDVRISLASSAESILNTARGMNIFGGAGGAGRKPPPAFGGAGGPTVRPRVRATGVDESLSATEAVIDKVGDRIGAVMSKKINAATKKVGRMGKAGSVLPRGSYSIGMPYLGYPGHYGADYPAATGTPVFALGAGQVAQAQSLTTSYGRHVFLNHPGGVQTRYAHMNSLLVNTGQPVAPGQQIGTVGSTGNSTGPHLHFEYLRGGNPINPASLGIFDRGGTLKPGWNWTYNGTGGDEHLRPVARAQGGDGPRPRRGGAQRIVLDLGEGMKLRGWMRDEIDGMGEFAATTRRMR